MGIVFGFLGAAACRQPFTDIVATNTEDVGRFDVSAAADGDRLQGHLCLADPAHADEIAHRVFEQLKSHHYASIVLDAYTKSAPVARYGWTPDRQTRDPLSSADNPCAHEGRQS